MIVAVDEREIEAVAVDDSEIEAVNVIVEDAERDEDSEIEGDCEGVIVIDGDLSTIEQYDPRYAEA